MSSTNRPGVRRKTDDQYFTRYPCALAICERLHTDGIFGHRLGIDLLEPSCGKGAFVRAMHDVWAPNQHGRALHGLDINSRLLLPEHRAVATGLIAADFLTYRRGDLLCPDGYDGIIGNPPYADAEAHVRHALSLLSDAPTAAVCFLLRLNFLAGIERQAGLYREHPPEFVYALDKRPMFRESSKTDSTEYGVFVWRKGAVEYETTTRYLAWGHYPKIWALAVQKLPAIPRVKKPPREKKPPRVKKTPRAKKTRSAV